MVGRALLLVGLAACNTGTIGEPSAFDPNVYNGIPSRDDAPADVPACSDAPLGAAVPIARLTNTEYRNTLRSLLPALSLPEVPLPADVVVEGFDNNTRAQTPSATLIEQYGSSAEAVADSVVASLRSVLPCSESEADACATTFIDAFVTRAYRRPLTAAERTRYFELFQGAHAEYGFA
ncbi:MAG TPA: DUF1587 domain-containing protein, partial [Polyangiales bacterium]|nr:DUF1587 domain-containing protein [Polyangiales bacterium]